MKKNRQIRDFAPATLLSLALSACGGGVSNGGDQDYSVGGTLNGLATGQSVTLQNNGGDDLALNANGAFTFATALTDGSGYNVQVSAQPAAQTCSASNNTGTVNGANVTTVAVTCAGATYTVGGTLTGLAANQSVTLQNNGGDDLVLNANGSFTFATALADGASYEVQVSAQPAGQDCVASNNTGTLAGANVTSVNVACTSTGGGMSGTLDTTFNGTGYYVFDNPMPGHAEGYGIAVDSGGNIVVAGYARNGIDNLEDMAVWRLTSSGALDASFNAGLTPGYVLDHNAAGGEGPDRAHALSLIGGNITTGGHSRSTGVVFLDAALWRFNPDGTPDTTFSDGDVTHGNAAGGTDLNDFAEAVTVDGSGRIVAAGYSIGANGDNDMVIWRFDDDGTPDTTFNAGGTQPGIVTHHDAGGGDSDDEGYGIAIDASGRIVVVGQSTVSPGRDAMAIWRYNANGTLDTGFNAMGTAPGVATWTQPLHTFSGNAVTIDALGNILVTGWSAVGNSISMALWRFTPDGVPDPTFNAGSPTPGLVTSQVGTPNFNSGEGVVVDAGNRVVVAGYGPNTNGDMDMVIWRFNMDGTPDTTFNANGARPGIVIHHNAAGGGSNDQGLGLALAGDGKILVTGHSTNTDPVLAMTVWRYHP